MVMVIWCAILAGVLLGRFSSYIFICLVKEGLSRNLLKLAQIDRIDYMMLSKCIPFLYMFCIWMMLS